MKPGSCRSAIPQPGLTPSYHAMQSGQDILSVPKGWRAQVALGLLPVVSLDCKLGGFFLDRRDVSCSCICHQWGAPWCSPLCHTTTTGLWSHQAGDGLACTTTGAWAAGKTSSHCQACPSQSGQRLLPRRFHRRQTRPTNGAIAAKAVPGSAENSVEWLQFSQSQKVGFLPGCYPFAWMQENPPGTPWSFLLSRPFSAVLVAFFFPLPEVHASISRSIGTKQMCHIGSCYLGVFSFSLALFSPRPLLHFVP